MPDVLNGLLLGLQVALSLNNLLYCLLGVTLGTAIGVLPGVGPVVTISLLLPLTFGLPPETALIMLAGIYYGAAYGGSTTSILVNLPGESSSAITCIDGYQMAKNGRAGAALSVAAIGSFIAGTIGTLVVVVAAPTIASFAMQFGPAEYAALTIAALVATAALARGGIAKGLGMALLGILIGMIGIDVTTGVQRFTFGLTSLFDGVEFAVVAVGLFALSEIVVSIAEREQRELQSVNIGRPMLSPQEFRTALPAILRGTGVGSLFGILPGAGQTIASLSAYVLERSFSKNRDNFGKGALEGVAAPESANNAASQTAFIPTLTLGIPGSATMALMVGALMLQGINPGPQVLSSHPDLFWGLIVSMWIGNLFLLVLNLPLIGIWVRMITIPYRRLYPAILCFSCIGIYSVSYSTADLVFACFFGLLGYLFVKCGASPALFILGLVLGPMFEENFRRAMLISKGNLKIFLESPIAVSLLVLTALLVLSLLIPSIRRKKEVALEAGDEN